MIEVEIMLPSHASGHFNGWSFAVPARTWMPVPAIVAWCLAALGYSVEVRL